MESKKILIIIILMALVSSACRVIPTLLLANRTLPKNIQKFLNFSPVAILYGMLLPAIVLNRGRLDLSFANQFFWISWLSLAVVLRTRNIALTVLAGVVSLALWRYFEA